MTATPIPLAITGTEMKDKGEGKPRGIRSPPQGGPGLLYNLASKNDPLLDFSDISLLQKLQNGLCELRLTE